MRQHNKICYVNEKNMSLDDFFVNKWILLVEVLIFE